MADPVGADNNAAPRLDSLKPCPFCGGTDLHIAGASREFKMGQVYCERCDSYGPSRLFSAAGAVQAAWNKRAGETS